MIEMGQGIFHLPLSFELFVSLVQFAGLFEKKLPELKDRCQDIEMYVAFF